MFISFAALKMDAPCSADVDIDSQKADGIIFQDHVKHCYKKKFPHVVSRFFERSHFIINKQHNFYRHNSIVVSPSCSRLDGYLVGIWQIPAENWLSSNFWQKDDYLVGFCKKADYLAESVRTVVYLTEEEKATD